MKKLISMIALAAITFGCVYANAVPVRSVMQTDTTKKKTKKMKKMKDTTMKKDTSQHKK